MELVQVEILGTVVTNRYGTLAAGDILRTDVAYAKHLVEDAAAAKYVGAQQPDEPSGAPITRARRKKADPAPADPAEEAAKASAEKEAAEKAAQNPPD